MHEPLSGPDLWRLPGIAGRVNIVLGLLAATRIVLEIIQTSTLPTELRYFLIVGFEFILALGAVISGFGLMLGRPWSISLATLAGTASFVAAAIDLGALGQARLILMAFFSRTGREMPLSLAYGSRLLMLVIQALYWPILLGLLHIDGADAPRERRSFWIRVGLAALLTGLVELLLKWILGSDG